jgi:formylglycine-generating enzyme required for sulfatase activity
MEDKNGLDILDPSEAGNSDGKVKFTNDIVTNSETKVTLEVSYIINRYVINQNKWMRFIQTTIEQSTQEFTNLKYWQEVANGLFTLLNSSLGSKKMSLRIVNRTNPHIQSIVHHEYKETKKQVST